MTPGSPFDGGPATLVTIVIAVDHHCRVTGARTPRASETVNVLRLVPAALQAKPSRNRGARSGHMTTKSSTARPGALGRIRKLVNTYPTLEE